MSVAVTTPLLRCGCQCTFDWSLNLLVLQLWDTRVKRCVDSIQNRWQVTAVCFDDNAQNIFHGGLDNKIKVRW